VHVDSDRRQKLSANHEYRASPLRERFSPHADANEILNAPINIGAMTRHVEPLQIWLRHDPVFTNTCIRELVTRVILFAG